MIQGIPTKVTDLYATKRLGMPKSRAYELLLAGAELEGLTQIDTAFMAGLLSWSKVLLLCQVATPAIEAEWIECARQCTYDELRAEIAGLKKGQRPRKRKYGLQHSKRRISALFDLLSAERWELLRATFLLRLNRIAVTPRGRVARPWYTPAT